MNIQKAQSIPSPRAKILVVGFNGKNNSSRVLVENIRAEKTDKLLLTNSFLTSEKELENKLSHRYSYVIAIGQKPDAKNVVIEKQATKNGKSLKTNFPIAKLADAFMASGFDFSFSENAGKFLCNNAYYVGLNYIKTNDLQTEMVFLHVPSKKSNFDFFGFAAVLDEFLRAII